MKTQDKKSTNVKFSARLQEAAQEKNLDQVTLARVTGITGAAINNYWNKGRVPKSEELHRIAKAIGTSMEWLLTGEDSNNIPVALAEWKQRAHAAEQKLDALKSGVIAVVKKF